MYDMQKSTIPQSDVTGCALTMAKSLLFLILILTPLISRGQQGTYFGKLKRDETYKFEELNARNIHFSLYYCISSKPVIINDIQYWPFNFSINKKGASQLIRFENDRVLIATEHSLQTKGTTLGESVLFDFSAPVGTSWLVDMENSGFITTSILEFENRYWSNCLNDTIFAFQVQESIKASHEPYFVRFYVSKDYGVIGVEMEQESYPQDSIITMRHLNPLLKKLNCAEIAQKDTTGLRLIPTYR